MRKRDSQGTAYDEKTLRVFIRYLRKFGDLSRMDEIIEAGKTHLESYQPNVICL